MLKTYHGSCHCGAVTFQAGLDLATGTGRCNCSYCRKARYWSARVMSVPFRALRGGLALGSYVCKDGAEIDHGFCVHCGVTLFARGNIAEMGGAFPSVMVAALDDAAEAELLASPVTWSDGLHDAWWSAPAEVRHL